MGLRGINITSFVVVLVRQRRAWYPKKPANNKETMIKNTTISS